MQDGNRVQATKNHSLRQFKLIRVYPHIGLPPMSQVSEGPVESVGMFISIDV